MIILLSFLEIANNDPEFNGGGRVIPFKQEIGRNSSVFAYP
jgi:hypothetical protein